MELVSKWNLGVYASEFIKFKYYCFKALISFFKLSGGLVNLAVKILFSLLALFFIKPKLYKVISPTKKILVNQKSFFKPGPF